ncbi:hypothetical protein BX666DRAFT_1996038 [Dichotomocladium elegans]|nr:hypothetical protein BX666DRAFT_1996038 [Dichotomocladium elegans]
MSTDNDLLFSVLSQDILGNDLPSSPTLGLWAKSMNSVQTAKLPPLADIFGYNALLSCLLSDTCFDTAGPIDGFKFASPLDDPIVLSGELSTINFLDTNCTDHGALNTYYDFQDVVAVEVLPDIERTLSNLAYPYFWLPPDESNTASSAESVWQPDEPARPSCGCVDPPQNRQVSEDRPRLTSENFHWDCDLQSYIESPWLCTARVFSGIPKSKKGLLLDGGGFEARVIRAYRQQAKDELSLEIGQTVQVISVYDDGFCFGRVMVPSSFFYGMFPLSHLEGAVDGFSQESKEWKHIKQKCNDVIKETSPRKGRSTSVICKICDTTFSSKRSLYRHLMKYSRNSGLKCVECGAVYSRADALKRHKKNRHKS